MAEGEEVKRKNYNLDVKLTTKIGHVDVEVSTFCADWNLAQKFLKDFQEFLDKQERPRRYGDYY